MITVTGAVPLSQLLLAGKQLTFADVLGRSPRILVIVLANAVNEELLFRDLSLHKLEPFFRKPLANCLDALVFSGLHLGVSFTRDQMAFLVGLLPTALTWGAITQKTSSAWVSVPFHTGTDIPVILAVFSTLI